jgi:hypothetical protein
MQTLVNRLLALHDGVPHANLGWLAAGWLEMSRSLSQEQTTSFVVFLQRGYPKLG